MTTETSNANVDTGKSLINQGDAGSASSGGDIKNTDANASADKTASKDEGSLLSRGDSAKEGDTAKKGQTKTPIEYTDFKLPEGIALNETLITEFKTVAKELGLSQEAAQKLVDLQSKSISEAAKASDETYKGIVKQWRDEAAAEMGANFKQEIFRANKALKTFGDEKLREELEASGMIDNPRMLKFLRNVGATLAEDGHAGNGASPDTRSHAEVLYGKKK